MKSLSALHTKYAVRRRVRCSGWESEVVPTTEDFRVISPEGCGGGGTALCIPLACVSVSFV